MPRKRNSIPIIACTESEYVRDEARLHVEHYEGLIADESRQGADSWLQRETDGMADRLEIDRATFRAAVNAELARLGHEQLT